MKDRNKVLWALLLVLTSFTSTALAQEQVNSLNATAPMRIERQQTAQRAGVNSIEFHSFDGYLDDGVQRVLGVVKHYGETNIPNGGFKLVGDFPNIRFNKLDGASNIIGANEADFDRTKWSWIKVKSDQDWVSVDYRFQHVGLAGAGYFSGGAIEGTLQIRKLRGDEAAKLCGPTATVCYEIFEEWSTPECGTMNTITKRIAWGSCEYPGAPSRMYIGPKTDVYQAADGGVIHLIANSIVFCPDGSILWRPLHFKVWDNNKVLKEDFNIGWARIVFDDTSEPVQRYFFPAGN